MSGKDTAESGFIYLPDAPCIGARPTCISLQHKQAPLWENCQQQLAHIFRAERKTVLEAFCLLYARLFVAYPPFQK